MKILMLSRLFYPHVGGVERHLANINSILVKRGFEVTVLTEKYDKSLKDKEKVDNVDIVRFSYPTIRGLGLFFIWAQLFKYLDLIRKSDLVHIHDVFIWYLPFRFLFPFKPVFVTFHGYEGYPIKKSAKVIRKISEILSNGNLCVGDFIKKWYGTKPTYVTYGAVDTKKFKPSEKKKFKYDAIFASRLDDQTGILTYLEAVKLLREDGKKFKLLVLGGGKYKKEADRVATALGFVDDPSAYFKDSNFAFISRYLAILEALSSKKLVFAVYDNPLKRDYLKMTPFSKWIIVEKDPKKLAEKILHYLNNPKRAEKLINPAYQWAQKQTWEKMVNLYLHLWGLGEV